MLPPKRQWRASTASPLGSVLILIVAAAVCAVGPSVFPNRYYLTVAVSTLIWVGLSVSWNIFSGYTRYLSVGHSAFFGVGAYGALLSIDKVGLAGGLVVGGLAAGALGLVVGLATLRLKGFYFALATLGLTQFLFTLSVLWSSLTSGTSGAIAPGVPDLDTVYKIAAACVIALLALQIAFFSTRYGLRTKALGDDEDALSAAGVKVTAYKIVVFTFSVVAVGVFGGLYAYQISFIDPASVFSLIISFQIVMMVLLGGRGTIWGPVVGAVALSFVNELLWSKFPAENDMFLGAVLVVVVLFIPLGLVGTAKKVLGLDANHFV
jgi:branched-chain amino acid transport system permease protein